MFIPPSSYYLKIFYYFNLPVKYLLYLSIPDVRRQGSEQKALLSIGMCFCWLGLFTFILVEALGVLSNLLGINAAVMGLTVGAWATSYPAVWSSVVVARSGYGNVATCNALGSIVFSNYLGLGLPWLVYSIVYGGKPYSGLQDQGVAFSILTMMMILVATYIMIALNKFVLSAW
jgi:Ca2+/Na+ antiporter